jgi:hypothetical protein
MRMRFAGTGTAVAVCLLLASCARPGPRPPPPGTPAHFWAVAHTSFSEGDLAAAHRNLDQLTLSDNPYRKEAAIWLMVLSAGMASGAMEWADALDEGGKAAGMEQAEYERLATAARRTADQHAMHLAELVRARHGGPGDAEVRLAFKFPAVDANLPAEAERVRRGGVLPPADTEPLRLAMERRGVALTLCRLAGAGVDTAKASALLTGDARLKPAAFEWYLAQELDALSALYSPGRLDQTARARLLLGEAAAALAASGDSPEVRKLAAAVDERLKKARK